MGDLSKILRKCIMYIQIADTHQNDTFQLKDYIVRSLKKSQMSFAEFVSDKCYNLHLADVCV